VRSAEEVLPAAKGDDGGGEIVTLRTELRLAHPSIEPLARPASDPDPLQAFAAAVATLRPDRGEEAVVCFDLLPATGRRGTRLRRRLRRQARRRYRERLRWGELWRSQRRGSPIGRPRARPGRGCGAAL